MSLLVLQHGHHGHVWEYGGRFCGLHFKMVTEKEFWIPLVLLTARIMMAARVRKSRLGLRGLRHTS